jgi:hypothetical protein
MGSVPEGTRIGIGNETDIMMIFNGFDEPPFRVEEGDSFHLFAIEKRIFLKYMEKYLEERKRFIFHKFMGDLLDIVSSCIESIFNGKKLLGNLMRKTTNAEFYGDQLLCADCKKRRENKMTIQIYSSSANIAWYTCLPNKDRNWSAVLVEITFICFSFHISYQGHCST